MRQLFSKADLRDLSLVVAIVMLLASVPSNPGFVVSGPSRPQLTVNVCQPIQMFDRVSNILLARPATVLTEFVLRDSGSTAVKKALRLVDFRVAPDTPPPKRAV
ncbi:MAG: hypothetical protein WBP51_11755 [Candidatus Sulfotelmatobacter sp.]|jgi:hypothetical protein